MLNSLIRMLSYDIRDNGMNIVIVIGGHPDLLGYFPGLESAG